MFKRNLKYMFSVVAILLVMCLLSSCNFKERQTLSLDISNGNVEEVRKYFTENPESINKRISILPIESEFMISTTYPLHYACYFNDIDMIKMLVEEFGANVNLIDESYDVTPIFNCFVFSRISSVEVSEYLISKGADVKYMLHGNSLIDEASKIQVNNSYENEQRVLSLVAYLHDEGASATSLSIERAIKNNNISLANYLFENFTYDISNQFASELLYSNVSKIYKMNTNVKEDDNIDFNKEYTTRHIQMISYLLKYDIDLDYNSGGENLSILEMLEKINYTELLELLEVYNN